MLIGSSQAFEKLVKEGQSQEPNGTLFNGNGDYSQKFNGYSNPNGLHSEK